MEEAVAGSSSSGAGAGAAVVELIPARPLRLIRGPGRRGLVAALTFSRGLKGKFYCNVYAKMNRTRKLAACCCSHLGSTTFSELEISFVFCSLPGWPRRRC